MNIMSTREALEAATALQAGRSADVVLRLAQLEQEIGWAGTLPGGLCSGHQAAVNRLAELHMLVDHLVANLRGGNGVPPTPAADPERRRMPPVVHLKQGSRPQGAQGPHHAVLRPAERPRHGNAAPARTDGWLNVAGAAQAAGLSRSWFEKLRASGRIPEPAGGNDNRPLWRVEQLDGIKLVRPKYKRSA